MGKAGLVGVVLSLGILLASAACEESGGGGVPGASENGASSSTVAPPTPTPTLTPTPTPLPTPTAALCSEALPSADYENLARYPTEGDCYTFHGEVVQIIGVENAPNAVAMRINITDEGWGWTDTILAQSEDGHSCFSAAGGRVLEGDIIAFVGITAGEYTYAAVLGNSITLPAAVCLRPADIPTAMPQMPPIVGFGESFNTDGFELTIGAPEAYHPGNSFSDVTHRVKVRLRNTADQTNEFFGGNVGAVVGGQVLDPDYCFDCPSNLVSFTEFISGAETTGYLYYTDEPEEIRVKSGLFGDEEIVVR